MNRQQWCTAVLTAALLGTACGRSPESPQPGPAAPSAAPAPAIASSAQPPAAAEGHEILSVLSVEREVDLLAQREGVVVDILHDQGGRVEAGAVLARLDDRDLLAQMDRARADLHVAENNVKYNEAELKARQAAHRRAQEMRKLGLNSDADLEEAEFRAAATGYDLESWKAVVDRNRADIRKLEVDLEKTRLRAPFGGVVARRLIRPGQNVRKDDPCFRLSQLAPLQVRFLVPETAARRPREGDNVNVVAATAPERVYSARILRVSPVVDAASGGIEVMAQLTNPDLQELRPGMAVRVLWASTPSSAR